MKYDIIMIIVFLILFTFLLFKLVNKYRILDLLIYGFIILVLIFLSLFSITVIKEHKEYGSNNT